MTDVSAWAVANLAWLIAPAAALIAGIALVGRGTRNMGRGRVGRGSRGMATGLIAIGGALVAALIGLNMQSYSRLTYEKPVAEVRVYAVDTPRKVYNVTVVRKDKPDVPQHCQIQGDDWMLSGRVQKWKPWAVTLGMNATYQLDQVANRYAQAIEGNGKPITACDLTPPDSPLVSKIPLEVRNWAMQLAQAEDRRFGSASFMPLADGAVYDVIITQSGFNAEAANGAARAAVDERM